jgi:dTDP-4-amino-4,6-dideoxygalactose transaminase
MSSQNKIKFLPLIDINSSYEDEIKIAFNRIVDSGIYLNGEYNSKFQTKLCSLLNIKYCVNCSNGFDSLKIIFKSLIELNKLKIGDQVLVPGFTFIASITSIIQSGLIPVLVDVDYDLFNIDLTDLKRKISSKTKAILFVHLFGRNSWTNELKELLEEKEIIAIEDCAQSIGANHEDRKLGSIGLASAFSFYPGKNVGALGDAGAICTDSVELYEVARKYSNYGSSVKYNHEILGENCRMDEVQAAVLSIKIDNVNYILNKREEIANEYLEHINNPKIELPNRSVDNNNAWHLFVIKTKFRNVLKEFLHKNHIETIIHYPIPYHKQPFCKDKISLPVTEKISEECLSIPNHENLTKSEINYIIKILNAY